MRRLNWWKTACAACVLCAATAIALPAQTFTTLFSFDQTDGDGPKAALVQATDGNLYGTTEYGGASRGCDGGCGTVFKITPSGTLTTVYSFCPQSGCPDGSVPFTTLIRATDGNLYGTTLGVYGTVFKMTLTGTLTTLYSFCSQRGCTDGYLPLAGLAQATDGNLYGTTYAGGANGYGTVFKITPSGSLRTVYSFCPQSGCEDGSYPLAGLVQGTDGKLYGTASEGGANNDGVVYKTPPVAP